jgi:hypothetical protein
MFLIHDHPPRLTRQNTYRQSWYREYDYLNNARQVPKLPDWAIMDITQPRTSRYAAKVADADFFDEWWQLKKK